MLRHLLFFILFIFQSSVNVYSNPVVIVVGPPGSGKGFLSQFLSDNFGFIHISAGDLLRKAVEQKTFYAREIEDKLKKGLPVDSKIMHNILKDEILKFLDKPFIIDGFGGQYAEDCDFLINLLREKGALESTVCFYLQSCDAMCKERMAGRIICSVCSHVYNRYTYRPKIDNTCDACGSLLTTREDKEQIIESRLGRYRKTMEPNYLKFRSFVPYLNINVDDFSESRLELFYSSLGEKLLSDFALLIHSDSFMEDFELNLGEK